VGSTTEARDVPYGVILITIFMILFCSFVFIVTQKRHDWRLLIICPKGHYQSRTDLICNSCGTYWEQFIIVRVKTNGPLGVDELVNREGNKVENEK